MKQHLFLQVGLTVLLLAYSLVLIDRMPPTTADRERIVTDSHLRLRMSDPRGIDVHGRPVDPALIAGTVRVGTFVLRQERLAADIRFWREVARLLPNEAGVRLVAYCDGTRCADAVRQDPSLTEFPVIAFGEVVGSQALMNADLNGDLVLVKRDAGDHAEGEKEVSSRFIRWRDVDSDPSAVVRSVLQ